MKEDIIRMAREAGFAVSEKARQHQPNCIFHTQFMVDELLERFAAFVRADEREAIATMVEGLFDDPNDAVLAFIVDAIRARGNT